MKQAALAIKKNTTLIEKVKSARYPQVALAAGYNQNYGPNDSSNINNGEWNSQDTWQVGLNLKWNIFDFGTTQARINKTRILERQSRYDQRRIALELNRALKEAVTRINTAVTDYHNAETEFSMTRQTATIEQVRFDQGVGDINDLLYARARNQLARSRFITAGYAYKNACFYLDYLLEKGKK